MAWTYDISLLKSATPSSTYPPATLGQRYQVRLYIQDINTLRQLFQDEEIDFQITKAANAYCAAADLCDVLVARAGGVKRKKISEFEIEYDPQFYRQLGGQLRANGAGHQVPYAGGISIGDKLSQQSDKDWVTPAIPRGLDDNPQAPAPATPSTGPLTTL